MSTEIYHGPQTEMFIKEIKRRLWLRPKRGKLGRDRSMGFVLGNGESRKGIDLCVLWEIGPIYGCNALYRDFTPDMLFSMDEGMTWEILEVGYKEDLVYREYVNHVATWKLVVNKTGERITDPGWAAGPTALHFMCLWEPDIKDIYLVGFDLFGSNGKINNVYKDTPCYSTSDAVPSIDRNWIKTLAQVFENNPDKNFYRVGITPDNPDSWKDIKNITFLRKEQFWSSIARNFSNILNNALKV